VAHRFVAHTLANGVVINWTLNAERVVRLAPPLTVAPEEIDFALEAMRRALDAVRAEA
jgi:4-aminobutyrate aminotransferase-like enzyme